MPKSDESARTKDIFKPFKNYFPVQDVHRRGEVVFYNV